MTEDRKSQKLLLRIGKLEGIRRKVKRRSRRKRGSGEGEEGVGVPMRGSCLPRVRDRVSFSIYPLPTPSESSGIKPSWSVPSFSACRLSHWSLRWRNWWVASYKFTANASLLASAYHGLHREVGYQP